MKDKDAVSHIFTFGFQFFSEPFAEVAPFSIRLASLSKIKWLKLRGFIPAYSYLLHSILLLYMSVFFCVCQNDAGVVT